MAPAAFQDQAQPASRKHKGGRMISLSWAAVFLIETIGAVSNFKRSKLLFAFLAFASLSEPVTYVILRYYPGSYCWSWWAVEGIQNLMLVGLGAHIVGKFVAEKNKWHMTVGTLFAYGLSIVLVADLAFTSDSLKDRLLNGEMAANSILLAIMFSGWIGRRSYLSAERKWIACGLMAWIGGSMLMTALWLFWNGAGTWYMAGTAPALLIWAARPLFEAYRQRKERVKITAFAIAEMAAKLTKKQTYALSEETRGWITENIPKGR